MSELTPKFEKYLVDVHTIVDNNLPIGIQHIFRFPNGLGASVIRITFDYRFHNNKYEIAVIEWDGNDWEITYKTPVCNELIKNLTKEEVDIYLEKIKES